jgi:two-component system sensor kinase FixL
MGLPIAQRFVEAHGGLLSAANRAEGGAVFTVFLPETVEEKAGALA